MMDEDEENEDRLDGSFPWELRAVDWGFLGMPANPEADVEREE